MGRDGWWVLAAGLVTAWVAADPRWVLLSLVVSAGTLTRRSDGVVEHLAAATAVKVAALEAEAARLEARDRELAALEAQAGCARLESSPADGGTADAAARADLAAAREALAASELDRAAIARARERGAAAAARIRCTLEAVRVKCLRMKAIELEGDAIEASGRRRDLEALDREVTACVEAVGATWGEPANPTSTPGEKETES